MSFSVSITCLYQQSLTGNLVFNFLLQELCFPVFFLLARYWSTFPVTEFLSSDMCTGGRLQIIQALISKCVCHGL